MSKDEKIILITAGPTREYIDPIRFISNLSSGKLGYLIAKIFSRFNNKVILISGPTNIAVSKRIKVFKVETAKEMFETVKKFFKKAKIFISTAAVCDWRVIQRRRQKIKKQKFLTLKLISNVDILKYFGERKREDQILVGFALETDIKNSIKYAFKKLKEKNLDIIVLNYKDSLGSNFIKPIIIFKDGKILKYKKLPKEKFAKILVSTIKKYEKKEINCLVKNPRKTL